ncbi:MAG: SMP-30/gluconolactonase/LRE family protein [Porticoccaceae bacterium]
MATYITLQDNNKALMIWRRWRQKATLVLTIVAMAAAGAVHGSEKPKDLAGLATVAGTVEAAKPFKAAQVYLLNLDKRIQYMVFTKDGAFEAVALFPGRYQVTARAIGLESASQELTLAADEDKSGFRINMEETKDPQQFPSSVDPKTVRLFNAAGWNDPSAPVVFGSYDEIYPPELGRVVLEKVCFACHGENTFALAPRSEGEWAYAVDYMRGTWLGEQNRLRLGEGILAGSASNFHFGLQDRKEVIAYLAKHLGPDKPSRAVRTDVQVPFDEDELAKAQLIEYYVGDELQDRQQTATVGSELHATATAGEHMLITLQLDAQGNVWAVDRAVPSQLVRLDPRTGEQKFYVLPDPRAGVHDLVIDRQGIIWVAEFTRNPDGTGDGIPRLIGFNPKTEKWEHILDADPENVTRNPNKGPLMAPTVDSKGNVYMNWMLNGAIAKWNPATEKMSVFLIPTPAATPYGAAMDANDNLWVALWNGGKLAKFDTNVEQWTEFTPPTYPANLRRGPNADSANNIWVGIWAGGPRPGKIAKLDQNTGRWTEWDIPHRGAQPYEASVDKDDNIWFPQTGGPDLPSVIGRFNPRTEKFTFYPKMQFVADSSWVRHSADGAVWYAPRYGAPPGHSGFGVLYPDKDQITTLAAYPLNGAPGYAFKITGNDKSEGR